MLSRRREKALSHTAVSSPEVLPRLPSSLPLTPLPWLTLEAWQTPQAANLSYSYISSLKPV